MKIQEAVSERKCQELNNQLKEIRPENLTPV